MRSKITYKKGLPHCRTPVIVSGFLLALLFHLIRSFIISRCISRLLPFL